MRRIIAALATTVTLILTAAPASADYGYPTRPGLPDSLMKEHHCGKYFRGHKIRGYIAIVDGSAVYRSGKPEQRRDAAAYCSK